MEYVVGGQIVKLTDETLQVEKENNDGLGGVDELHLVKGVYYDLSSEVVGLSSSHTCRRLSREEVLDWLEGFRITNSKNRSVIAGILENLEDYE